MSKLEDYANKYQCARFERRDGILLMTLHTDGGSLRWRVRAAWRVARGVSRHCGDRENRVVILTGTGNEIFRPRATPGTPHSSSRPSIDRIDRIHWEGRHLLMRLLEIEVPVISAINGPAWRHGEIPLLGDIVLAADNRAIPGFRPFRLRRGAWRRHAHRHALVARHEPRSLFPAHRPDPRCTKGVGARPGGRSVATRQIDGTGLGTGRGFGEAATLLLRYTVSC